MAGGYVAGRMRLRWHEAGDETEFRDGLHGGLVWAVAVLAVNSNATVRLITKAFDELKADANIGRAEALRRSMLSLIGSRGGYAHPSNWAPFALVGEGAR
jgi:CHAT domain